LPINHIDRLKLKAAELAFGLLLDQAPVAFSTTLPGLSCFSDLVGRELVPARRD
jgi:hypothetical protein